jgi:hypothetical protein
MIAGRDHTTTQKNSHDAYHMVGQPGILVAVVCDGCGSGEHSEVGAKLGARIVTAQVLRYFHNDPSAFRVGQIDRGLMQVRRSTLSQIQLLADSMGESFSRSISEYFLFTILGVVVTYDHAFVFGAGDGVVAMNEQVTVLTPPGGGNAPEYLSYGLVETDKKGLVPFLQVVADMPTSMLESLLIGTDGVKDLIGAAEKMIPGKSEKVGPLRQFWTDDKVFKNSFTIHRRLNLINRTVPQVDYERKVVNEEHGHLPDDTTLVTLRRRK